MFTAKANDEGSEAVTEKRHPSSLFFYEYLGEGAAQFDVRRCRELSLGAHGERAGVKAVQVGHDQQQVRRGLYWQEAAPRHVDAQSVVEAFDGGADRRLQLDDVLTAVERLTAETRTGEETCWVVVEKYLILSHVFCLLALQQHKQQEVFEINALVQNQEEVTDLCFFISISCSIDEPQETKQTHTVLLKTSN